MVAIDGFLGPVLTRDDEGYEQVRAIWNAAIDRRPAVIARCTGAADVVAAVRYAREQGLTVSIRGGGHHIAGNALVEDGLVIDCSLMTGVHVDPAARIARAASGALWGPFDHETQLHGLATTGGVVTHTGVAGLTLGGGIGWLHRKHGLTIDNLVAADLVTADGRVLRASAEENPDLFWGLRGGGGNFGVVTSFDFALHEVGPTILGGPVYWPLEDGPEVLRHYRDFIATVPDEFMSILSLRRIPPLPAVPEELRGRLACGIVMCWAGPIEQGEQVVRPLRSFGKPLLDLLAPKPYLTHQSTFDLTVPHGLNWYWKTAETAGLKDELIDTLIEHTARITSRHSYTVVFQLGGAVERIGEDATAYSHRDAAHNVNINAGWETGDAPDEHVGWARAYHAAVQPHEVGVYVNFLSDDSQERVRAAYGEETYGRLAALKRRYDPDNFFRVNLNILPG